MAACATPQPEEPSRPPRIAFESSVHSFDEVERGSRISHRFTFVNRGEVELTVDKLRASCGCTAEIVGGRFVPPGNGGSIDLQCDTSELYGRQRRTVSVYSNDPEQPVTVLRLVGRVNAAAAILPSRLHLGRLHRGKRAPREARLVVREGLSDIDVLPAADAPFGVTLEPTPDPRRSTLIIMPTDGAPLGTFATRLRAYAPNTREPLVEVAVSGEIVADVEVSPERLTLAPGTSDPAFLLVDNEGTRPVRVTGVNWQPAIGRAEVETVKAGDRYRIRLTAETKSATVAESTVTIMTDHPEQPAINVPVTIGNR